MLRETYMLVGSGNFEKPLTHTVKFYENQMFLIHEKGQLFAETWCHEVAKFSNI